MSETASNPHATVTVIILAYNTPDLLVQCLQGFFDSCSAMGWQIIVVDNGSEEEISAVMDGKFDGVDVIRSERNLGFAGGNNIGLLKAKGEFVILMNSDVIAQAETLASLVEAIRADPRIGAMSPGLLTAEGKPQAFAFGSQVTPGYLMRRAVRRMLRLGYAHDWAVQEPIDVGWVSAACICVRRRVIEEIGNFDERFPLYFEDTDWGLRMIAAGWRVVYNPLLHVMHLGGASQVRGPATRGNLYYRSLLLFCEKHYGARWKFVLQPLLSLYRMLARTKLMIFEKTKAVETEPVQSSKAIEELAEAAPSVKRVDEGQTHLIPEFSVIMPVWNRAALVARAVESVLRQSFNDFELIIVDDGSEDGLERAVAPFLSDSVIYHRIEHAGLAAARNVGLSIARGRYIAWLDSDNVWDPRFLETMRKNLNRESIPRHVAYCMYRLFTKNRQTGEHCLDAIRGEEYNARALLKRNYIDINSLVHSRRAAEKTGSWDERLVRLSDWDYVVRLTSRYNPVFIPKPLVDYYYGFASNALTLNHKEQEFRKMVLKKNATYRHSITLYHDEIPYHFDHVPEKKYRNWVDIRKRPLDTSDFLVNGFPYMLQVEPSSRCNLKCPFCPTGRGELGREHQDMPFEDFRPIVDDMADYLLLLILFSWGEPLLNKNFPKMVQYANEQGIRTVTSTNGHVLNNEAFMASILESGLDTLIVAVDSLKQETYEVFRKNGDIGKVLEGIRKTVALKRRLKAKTRINFRVVVTRNNEDEIPEMRKVARNLGVDIFSVKSVNPNTGDELKDDGRIIPNNPNYRRYKYRKGTMERIRLKARCEYIWMLSNIAADGTVVTCCYNYDNQPAYGNIREAPFRDIWNGDVARAIRKQIWSDMDSIPRCKDCNVNFALSKGEWFPHYIDFTSGPIGRLKHKVRRSVLVPAARRILPFVR